MPSVVTAILASAQIFLLLSLQLKFVKSAAWMLENVQLTLNTTPEDTFLQPSSQMEPAGVDILG